MLPNQTFLVLSILNYYIADPDPWIYRLRILGSVWKQFWKKEMSGHEKKIYYIISVFSSEPHTISGKIFVNISKESIVSLKKRISIHKK